MANTSPESSITVIDSEESLLPLLDSIASLAVEPPSLYINMDGIAVGRHGSVSILSVHIAPTKETHLIDIHTLKEAAFSTTNTCGTSLKWVLESPTTPKVIFDIRNDSDALFNLFHISVDGIIDIQLMELETRRFWEQKVPARLVECIEKNNLISYEMKDKFRGHSQDGYGLLTPWNGSRFEYLNERPIKPEIILWCQLVVALLPKLYDTYNEKLRETCRGDWKDRVLNGTNHRIKLSQSSYYDTGSKSKIFGWDDGSACKRIQSWNNGVIMPTIEDGYVRGENYQPVMAPKPAVFENSDGSSEDEITIPTL